MVLNSPLTEPDLSQESTERSPDNHCDHWWVPSAILAGTAHSRWLSASSRADSTLCKESKWQWQQQTYQFGTLLASKGQGIVGFIPLPVRGAVNENDAILHQGLCPHQFIVRSIVDNIDDSGLASAAFQRKSMSSNLQEPDNWIYSPQHLTHSPKPPCAYRTTKYPPTSVHWLKWN